MKIQYFAKDGFPVERIIGKPITNLIRLILHTRMIKITIGSIPPQKWRRPTMIIDDPIHPDKVDAFLQSNWMQGIDMDGVCGGVTIVVDDAKA